MGIFSLVGTNMT